MKSASPLNILRERFAAGIAAVIGQPAATVDPLVRPAGDPQFGDYQCNAAMSLAKAQRCQPREMAERIVAATGPRLADVAEPLEIAGPGFINVRLKAVFLERQLEDIPPPPPADPAGGGQVSAVGEQAAAVGDRSAVVATDRYGIPPVARPLRVIVEYSQPNIAKQMHVGHLRSTIIGDVIARVLAFEGHEVIRQNHIGDWGTQFGMLIRWYQTHPLPTPQTHADVLEAIERDYQAANQRFNADEHFASEARRAVAELQGGEAAARGVWERICAVSWQAFTEIYQRLGVLLTPQDVRGESFYNEHLPGVVRELREKLGAGGGAATGGTAAGGAPGSGRAEVREDQGAVVVYLHDEQGRPLFKNPDGEILGMIIQKSDGAYLYATTDLAAIRFRLHELRFPSGGVGAQRVIYVTDARQKLHFEMFLATARAAGWIGPDVRVEHVTFGSVLGEDKRPLKTRAGQTVKLRELLDEAERRATELVTQRQAANQGSIGVPPVTESPPGYAPPGALSPEEMREIGRRVGIAAVKYADLRNDRHSDYVFSWDKMLALQGNTAPYLLYAYARIRSIYRKAAERSTATDVYAPDVKLALTDPAERALALRLARLPETIDAVAADLEPHVLCGYLYDLAAEFMRFYEACPVLDAPAEATRLSRMRLCHLTARALKLGLGLLGIETIERM